MSEARPTRSPSASRAPKGDPAGRDESARRAPDRPGPTATAPALSRERAATRLAPRLALIVAALAVPSALAAYLWTRPDPARLVEQAEADLQAGRFEAARALVRRLEGIRTPTPADRMLRARIDIGAGDDATALAGLRQLADDPKFGAQALYLSGLLHRRKQRLREAEADYRAALRRDPTLLGPRRELIYILGLQLRRRELDQEFKAMSRLAPLSIYDLYVWCLTHFVNWGSSSADDLQPFVAADPDDRQSRLAMARLLFSQAGEDRRFEEVLGTLPPDDPQVQALRIEQALSRGNVEEATRLIEATQAVDPQLDRLRARIALRRGDREAAVRYFRRALSDEPYDRVSNAELGKALLIQGHRDEAERYMARVHHLDDLYNLVTAMRKPHQDQTIADLNRLAQVCESAGLSDEARGWYSLAIRQDPVNQAAQQGLHRLGQPSPAPTGTR